VSHEAAHSWVDLKVERTATNIRGIISTSIYNKNSMTEYFSQLLTICCIAATPWFAAWIANGGKREDFLISVIGSTFFAGILVLLLAFFN
jgi:hypothetical protein